jgi:hypothetical protein
MYTRILSEVSSVASSWLFCSGGRGIRSVRALPGKAWLARAVKELDATAAEALQVEHARYMNLMQMLCMAGWTADRALTGRGTVTIPEIEAVSGRTPTWSDGRARAAAQVLSCHGGWLVVG